MNIAGRDLLAQYEPPQYMFPFCMRCLLRIHLLHSDSLPSQTHISRVPITFTTLILPLFYILAFIYWCCTTRKLILEVRIGLLWFGSAYGCIRCGRSVSCNLKTSRCGTSMSQLSMMNFCSNFMRNTEIDTDIVDDRVKGMKSYRKPNNVCRKCMIRHIPSFLVILN